jgi:hypothetical protein
MTNYSHLNFTTPPRNQGQIVTISYAVDGENEQVVSRSHDASDGTESYAVTALDNLVGKFEPWNSVPRFSDDGLWSAVD